MRLIELDPRFFRLEENGPVVGLTFQCPHCRATRLGVAFHHRGHEAMDDEYIRAHHGGDANHVWNLLSAEDFSSLTLTPSIDASHAGHWHGSVTNGEAHV